MTQKKHDLAALGREYRDLQQKQGQGQANNTADEHRKEKIKRRILATLRRGNDHLRQNLIKSNAELDRLAQHRQREFLETVAKAIVLRETIHGREYMLAGNLKVETPPWLVVDPRKLSAPDREYLGKQVLRHRQTRCEHQPIVTLQKKNRLFKEKIEAFYTLSDDKALEKFLQDLAGDEQGAAQTTGFERETKLQDMTAQADQARRDLLKAIADGLHTLSKLTTEDHTPFGTVQ